MACLPALESLGRSRPHRPAFVMTLAHSRHQYLEFVWDQSSATWLGSHRRAFEWFDGVPERVIIDRRAANQQRCVPK